jgi:8-oxo-dGTP pyrophosphatase MutT (NUDIX family)
MPFERSCGTVVFRKEDGKIYYLLLHYESSHWDFAKGHVEKGEDERTTAKRELAEETGINDAKFVEGFKERIRYFYKHDGETMSKEVVFFLVETKIKDVKISFEHKDFKWLPFDEAYKQVTFKNAKTVLKKANEFLTKRKTLSDFS